MISNLKPPLTFSNMTLPEVTTLHPYGSGDPVWK